MGNTPNSLIPISPQQWLQIRNTPSDQPGTPLLVRESTSKIEADYYDISVDGNLDCQINFLQKRKQTEIIQLPIMYDVKIKTKHLLDCSDRQHLEIYLERIYFRFVDFEATDIELLVTLKQVVIGFENLQTMAENYFVVTDKMIGFNKQGETKVWLNQNFGSLDIEQEQLVRSQVEMIKSITALFQKKLEKTYSWLAQDSFQSLLAVLGNVLKHANYAQIQHLISEKVKRGHRNKSSPAIKAQKPTNRYFTEINDCSDKPKSIMNKPLVKDISPQNTPIQTYSPNNQNKYSLIENATAYKISPNSQIQIGSKSPTNNKPVQFQYITNPFLTGQQQNQYGMSKVPQTMKGQFQNIPTNTYPSHRVYTQTSTQKYKENAYINDKGNFQINKQNGKTIEITQAELIVQGTFNRTSMLRSPNRLFSSILEQSEEWDESIAQSGSQSKQYLEKDANLALFEQNKGNYDGLYPVSTQFKKQNSTTSII